MSTSDIIPWAIHESSLSSAFDAFFFPVQSDKQRQASYLSIDENGLAVIDIIGPMARRLDWFERDVLGLVDTQILMADIERVKSDPSIKGVFLQIDSPGGIVDGTQELAAAVRSIGKPVIAYTDGMIASAAYWVASAADQIVATSTAQVGSVGVVATHIDRSKADEKRGIKRTYIYNGAFKRMANDAEPLTDEGKAYIQDMIDVLYDVFVEDVAGNRKLTNEAVKAQESRVFIGSAALENNLIDAVGDFAAAYKILKRRTKTMDFNELKADYPDIYKQAREEGRAEINVDEIREQGAKAERDRIAEIRDSAFDGQEALVDELIKTGASIDDARKRLIGDMKNKMQQGLDDLAASDPGDLGANPDDTHTPVKKADSKEDAGNKLDDEAMRIKKSQGCEYDEAFDKACAENPELSKVYFGK